MIVRQAGVGCIPRLLFVSLMEVTPMKQLGVLIAGLGLLSLLAPAQAELPPLIPRQVLFGNPVKTAPRISPDVKRFAYIAPGQK